MREGAATSYPESPRGRRQRGFAQYTSIGVIMKPIDIRAKRAEANQLNAKVHVGKNGINDATLVELKRHLKQDKLVKVKLLKSATEGGTTNQAQAEALAEATTSTLIEIRGHTAVFYRK
jgi:RNA-binding protein